MTKKYRNNYVKRGARMILIAAVVTCLLATTAFAYVGFTQYENPMELLRTFFGDEKQQSMAGGIVEETYFDYTYEYIQPTIERVPVDEEVAQEQVAPYVSDVGKSISHGDYTLTVVAHQYDAVTESGIIYYTLENPNGVRGYELQLDGEVWWPEGEKVRISNVAEKNYLIASETTDTKLSVACYYVRMRDEYDYLQLSFYQWINHKPGDMTPEAAVAFEEEYEVLTLTLDDGGGMRYLTSEEKEIKLTSIAIKIDFSNMQFLGVTQEDGTFIPAVDDCHLDYLAIRFKDGSVYTVREDTDEMHIDNTAYALIKHDKTVTYLFNRIVDIDSVEAVILNEYEYPVAE